MSPHNVEAVGIFERDDPEELVRRHAAGIPVAQLRGEFDGLVDRARAGDLGRMGRVLLDAIRCRLVAHGDTTAADEHKAALREGRTR